jgi:hypothetical protein
MGKIEDINSFRLRTGCGLREAKDAIDRYGSLEKALAALHPADPAAELDPYARAVADRERWHAKSSEYRNGLIRILNSTTDADSEIKELAKAAILRGDYL